MADTVSKIPSISDVPWRWLRRTLIVLLAAPLLSVFFVLMLLTIAVEMCVAARDGAAEAHEAVTAHCRRLVRIIARTWNA